MTRQKHVTLVRHRMIIDQIRLFCFNDLEKEHITNITFSNNKNEINYNNDYNSDNYKKLPHDNNHKHITTNAYIQHSVHVMHHYQQQHRH